MSFALLVFCVNVLFCGVCSWRQKNEPLDEYFTLRRFKKYKGINRLENLPNYYRFTEGLLYTVSCRRPNNYDLHWEVEPYGLKSLAFSSSDSVNEILMNIKLASDDQITIGCYSRHKKFYTEENISTTFYWNKIATTTSHMLPSSLPDAGNDAENKCYQKGNKEKFVIFKQKKWDYATPLFDLQTYTRINHQTSTSSLPVPKDEAMDGQELHLNQDVNNKTSDNDGWVPVVSGVAGVVVLLVLCFICYRFIRKKKQDEPTYAEPAVVYAQLQLEKGVQRRRDKRDRKNSHYAKILWFKSKKNVPKLKNASENIRSKTEDTQIGTVERINDLYSTAADTRIGTVERINDLYSTAAETRIETVEQINDLYSTAAETRIETVEQINDLYSTAAETTIGTGEHNLYSTVWS